MKKTALLILILLNLNLTANENLIWRTAMYATVATFYVTNYFGTDEAGVDLGKHKDVYFTRLNFRWLHRKNLFEIGDFSLDSYHSFSFGKWQSEIDVSDTGSITTIDYAPIFRIEKLNSFMPFLEYSIGGSLISRYEINDKKLGGSFSFNHMLGIGYKFNKFNFSLKYQHYSNNGIYEENNGVNFYLISLSLNY
jgi:hypothetical protein